LSGCRVFLLKTPQQDGGIMAKKRKVDKPVGWLNFDELCSFARLKAERTIADEGYTCIAENDEESVPPAVTHARRVLDLLDQQLPVENDEDDVGRALAFQLGTAFHILFGDPKLTVRGAENKISTTKRPPQRAKNLEPRNQRWQDLVDENVRRGDTYKQACERIVDDEGIGKEKWTRIRNNTVNNNPQNRGRKKR
jgi:hypothetical protein